MSFKGRILFFHGYAQSSLVFYAKSSALRKKLKKLGYKCIYLNGPLKLTPADFPSTDALSKYSTVDSENGEDLYRAWWLKPSSKNEHLNLQPAIDTIKDYVNDNKVIEGGDIKQDLDEGDKKLPIVGLIGFSQGAGLAGLLMGKFKELFGVDLKFVVLYSGFMLDTAKGSGNEAYHDFYTKPKGLKALHVLGELDTVVDEERSTKLYDFSKEYSTILKHPGGHFVPNSKVFVEHVTNWIESEQKEEDKKENDDLDDLLDMMDNIGKV